jgi:hypothetical protein
MVKVLVILLLISTVASAAVRSRGGLSIGTGDDLYINVTGDTMTGDLNTENIYPTADTAYDIGSDILYYKHLYVQGVSYLDDIGGTIIPTADDAYDIGRSDFEWKDLYIDGVAYIDGFAESLLPNADDTLDIGSATLEWKDLYIDGTAYIDVLDTASIISSVSGAISFGDDILSGTGTLSMEHLTSTDDATITDSLTVGTLTDGTLTITGGTLITATGEVRAEQLTTLDDLTVTDTALVDGTLTLATGSITDSSGAISFGTNDVTVGGDLVVSGNITIGAETQVTGDIKPSADLAYEIGGEGLRYVRVSAKEFQFDPDTNFIFDDNFVYLMVNGVEYARWGATAAYEVVIDGTYSEEIIDGTYSEVVIF